MSSNANDPRPAEGWRERVHEVIFEADTRQGRIFDVVLMAVSYTHLTLPTTAYV